MKKLYFGHPINVYDSCLEHELVWKISQQFPNWKLVNPSEPIHKEMYQACKDRTGNGMEYFTKTVLPLCDGGVFLPFENGKYGAGVATELVTTYRLGNPVWEINSKGVVTKLKTLQGLEGRILSVADTKKIVYGDK